MKEKTKLLFLIMFIVSLFWGINDVNAAGCQYGIICNYEYCGRRGSANNPGYLAPSCPSNSGNFILSVAYTCSSTSNSAADCKSFVSWAKIARNLGTSYENVNFGNYDEVFHNADFLKDKFNETGAFSCPSFYASLTNTIDDNTYSFSYTNNGGKLISANGNSSGKYSSQECINQGTSTSDIDARLEEITTNRATDTAIDQGKEEAENNTGGHLGNADDSASTLSSQDLDKIFDWAGLSDEYSMGDVGDPCSIISTNLKNILSNAFWLISVVGIILVVVMTAISFVKAIVGSDDEKLRDAFSHLITRIIVVIILLLLPMILTFIINIINNNYTGTVKIGDGGNVFCDITN